MSSPCTGNTGQPGTRFSYAELEGLWIKAGGSKGTAPIAAAIALAESGGCSGDINPTDNGGTQTSWSLWQISDGTHNKPVPGIMDPAINAQQAVQKYRASGWSPWGTYDTGAYKRYMNNGTTPDLNVPGSHGTITPATETAAIEPYSPDTCLFGFPGIAVPVLGNVGQFCLLPKHTARAWIGAGMIGVGIVIAMPAVGMILVSAGTRAMGGTGAALGKTGDALMLVPGAQGAGTALKAAGKGASSGGAAGAATGVRQQRKQAAAKQAAAARKQAGAAQKQQPPASGKQPAAKKQAAAPQKKQRTAKPAMKAAAPPRKRRTP